VGAAESRAHGVKVRRRQTARPRAWQEHVRENTTTPKGAVAARRRQDGATVVPLGGVPNGATVVPLGGVPNGAVARVQNGIKQSI
jgi:hypothetical protein